MDFSSRYKIPCELGILFTELLLPVVWNYLWFEILTVWDSPYYASLITRVSNKSQSALHVSPGETIVCTARHAATNCTTSVTDPSHGFVIVFLFRPLVIHYQRPKSKLDRTNVFDDFILTFKALLQERRQVRSDLRRKKVRQVSVRQCVKLKHRLGQWNTREMWSNSEDEVTETEWQTFDSGRTIDTSKKQLYLVSKRHRHPSKQVEL